MKKTIWVGSLVLLAFCYLSWHTTSDSKEAARTVKERQWEILQNVMSHGKRPSADQPFGHGGGRPVPKSDIQPCLDSFASIMGTYGITSDNPPKKITKMPAKTYFITKYESFAGDGFLNWLDTIVVNHDPIGRGANIDLRFSFGICTPEFSKAHPEAADRQGRIVVFVVPIFDSTGNGAGTVKGTQPNTGYEIGGLDP